MGMGMTFLGVRIGGRSGRVLSNENIKIFYVIIFYVIKNFFYWYHLTIFRLSHLTVVYQGLLCHKVFYIFMRKTLIDRKLNCTFITFFNFFWLIT